MSDSNHNLKPVLESDHMLVEEDNRRSLLGCLTQLRKNLETNHDLIEKVSNCFPAMQAKMHLLESVEDIDPSMKHVFDKAAEIILEDLEAQRKLKPSLYLVNAKTGMAIMPMGGDSIFTPPDFVGLDGKIHKSKPIVHPGITSSLALAEHEIEKHKMVLAKHGDKLAFAHMSDPDKIVDMAKEKISDRLMPEDADGKWEEVEIGRENFSGMEQSANFSFHRIELFSSILARKILSRIGNHGRCQIGGIWQHRGAKHRWYVVNVKFHVPDVSGPDKQLGQH